MHLNLNWFVLLLHHGVYQSMKMFQAITKFLKTCKFEELWRFELTDSEWNALEICREILMVSHHSTKMFTISNIYFRFCMHFSNTYLQKRPQLSVTPSPHLKQWLVNQQRRKNQILRQLQLFKGLNKLDIYHNRADLELFTLLHLFLPDSYWTPGILPDWTRTGTNFMLADHHTNFVSQS